MKELLPWATLLPAGDDYSYNATSYLVSEEFADFDPGLSPQHLIRTFVSTTNN